MLTLEQIQRLEEKAIKAVELIKALREENRLLKSELESANNRVEELEQIISDYRNSQVEIEEGIIKAIRQLEDLDSISEEVSAPATEKNEYSSISGDSLMEEKEMLFQEEAAEENKHTEYKPQSGYASAGPAQEKAEIAEPENQTDNTQLDIF